MNKLMLYSGYVQHTRTQPKAHSFRYKADSIWLDLQHLEHLDQISPFWSSSGFNLISFDRKQYLPSDRSLYDQACLEIEKKTAKTFTGTIYLLANLSCWGHCFNPISFFACYDNGQLRYLMAEVHNTPWGERFIYLHDVDQLSNDTEHFVEFDKGFHVSPFMPMQLKYSWRYKLNNEQFKISMNLRQAGETIFNASLDLHGQKLNSSLANQLPFRKPFLTFSILPRIYWQAFRLWLKKIPVYRHPRRPEQ